MVMSTSGPASGRHRPIAAAVEALDRQRANERLARGWLVAVAILVLAMIVVGGATRLTDSGLSITEWQPLLGAVPPLSTGDWQAAFDKYKQTLQYHSVNSGMSLEAFKSIFWWEWGHRFLGRLIGAALALPLLALWLTGRLRAGLGLKVLGVGLIVGLQGAIGWYMVQSGLVDRIDVNQYRLALHLSVAFVILGCLAWLILDLTPPRTEPLLATLPALARPLAAVLAAGVFSQVVIGGFVAGLKAGRAYNTWPLMDGQVIPDGLWRLSPWWVNLSENMTAVQFNHRLTAYVLVAVALWHALRLVRSADDERVSRSAVLLAAGLVAQMGIGVFTVLHAVPIGLGIIHQGFAAVVFAIAVWHLHAVARSGRSAS